jgi:N-acetylmuramoyl-L-alanine amidase
MSTGIKNGKHRTNNIYGMILIFLFIVSYRYTASAEIPKTEGKWVIVIDPGHGGRDPGATGQTSKEKNINLAIALKVAKYLRENISDVKVILTRDDDSTVDLYERPKIANRNNADLFVSIHTNWADSKSVMGSETWIMGLASSDENLKVAMKENEVILLEDDYSTKYQGFDPKSPESYIIFSLTQNVYQKQSLNLAWEIQTELKERVNRKDRGVKQAGFIVLYNTTMPSVLVETGFITNPAEEKYLNSQDGQDYIASAIYRACRDYVAQVDMRSGITVDPTAKNTSSPGSKTSPSESAAPSQPLAVSVSDKVIFTVQVATATSHTEIKPENFKGLNNIEELNTGERFRYITGRYEEYSEAVKYRKKIESIYPDAFIIAVQNNKILPLQQALDKKRKK